MTCIIVLKTNKGKLVFGGDRRVTWGVNYGNRSSSKLVKYGPILIAGAGSSWLMQLFLNTKLKINFTESVEDFIYKKVYKKYKLILKDFDIINSDNDLKSPENTNILLGVRGRLFNFTFIKDEKENESGIYVDECIAPYTIGSGSDVALGAILVQLNELKDKDFDLEIIKYIIKISMQITSSVIATVSSDFDIITE